MNKNISDEQLYKYTTILNILKHDNIKFNKEMDLFITQKRFDNEYELSLGQNILRIDKTDITKHQVLAIIEKFFNLYQKQSIFKTRILYDLIKISYLPSDKLTEYLSLDTMILIHKYLRDILKESKFIHFDFMILVTVINFNDKYKKFTDECYMLFNTLKRSVFAKIISFEYPLAKKQKESYFLCWLDKILKSVIVHDINIKEFISITKKIIPMTYQNLYTYRKVLYSLTYLLLQEEYSTCEFLRTYHNAIKKEMMKKLTNLTVTYDELKSIIIKTLAEEKIFKEDFYYMFDAIFSYKKNNLENKNYILDIYHYLLHFNQRFNIFSHRFIRNYFFNTITATFEDTDAIQIKEKSLNLLIKLLHTDVFFTFNRIDIVNVIIKILGSINREDFKLTHNNFYKYCDILDYIYANNPDLVFPNTINRLCVYNHNCKKIENRFNLSQIKAA